MDRPGKISPGGDWKVSRMPHTDVAEATGSRAPATDAEATSSPLAISTLVRVTIPALLRAATLAVIVNGYAAPLTNPDTYFHLRFGYEFLHGWSLRDPGSVTSAATAHWVPTQWLPEVAMARLDEWFGLAGVAWFAGVQSLALVAAWYLTARRRAEPLVAFALLAVGFTAASIGLSARPQVMSYVLVVVTVDAWLRTVEDGRPRWWLVPLTWFWAMYHGMWPVGIALGGVVLIGMALDRRTTARRLLTLALVPLLSAVAAALTPVGPELYAQEVRVQSRARFFSEWHSPNFSSHACLALALILVVMLMALLRGRRPEWVTILLFLVSAACAVWTWRTVPAAAAVLVPLAAGPLQDWLGRRSKPPGRRELAAVVVGCLVAAGALGVAVRGQTPDPTGQPTWLQPAMTSLPSGTEVLSTWGTSAILMWRFPDLDLISHGYGDTYTVPELQRSADIQSVAPGWVEDLRQTGAKVAVLPPDDALAYALTHEEHWQVVHHSDDLEMLTAPPGWASQ
jgi:hypothetical protein